MENPLVKHSQHMNDYSIDYETVNATDDSLTGEELLELIKLAKLAEPPGDEQVVIQSEVMVYYDFVRSQIHQIRNTDGTDVLILERNIIDEDGVTAFAYVQMSSIEAKHISSPDSITEFWDDVNALQARPCVVTLDNFDPKTQQFVTHMKAFENVEGSLPETEPFKRWTDSLNVVLKYH